jgi:hypothetical protein
VEVTAEFVPFTLDHKKPAFELLPSKETAESGKRRGPLFYPDYDVTVGCEKRGIGLIEPG